MTLFNRAVSTIGAVALALTCGEFVRAEVQFQTPDNSAPANSIGGGTRGNTPVNDFEVEESSTCALEFEIPEGSAFNPTLEEEESDELNFLNPEGMTSMLTTEDSSGEDSLVQITDETPSNEMTQVHSTEYCEQEVLTDEI